jgi:hypothetical protein
MGENFLINFTLKVMVVVGQHRISKNLYVIFSDLLTSAIHILSFNIVKYEICLISFNVLNCTVHFLNMLNSL